MSIVPLPPAPPRATIVTVALPPTGCVAHRPGPGGYACPRPHGDTPPGVVALPVAELHAAWRLCPVCWPLGLPR